MIFSHLKSFVGVLKNVLKANTWMLTIVFFLSILFFINVPSNSEEFNPEKSHEFYKEYYMSKDGRIIDPNRKHITTSEGQSYMLLQSLLINDKTTFDLVYKWSKNNIQRSDRLFSWLWGENQNGEWKVLDPNSAADADVDIAFALILAHEKWGGNYYLKETTSLMDAIWNNETKEIDGHLVLMPGVVQMCCEKIEINPSYFSPYAFKIFKEYDPNHDWNRLVDSSYYYLEAVTSIPKSHLPPDWFYIENGQIIFEEKKSDFSYEAIRVFPRIFMDYKFTGEKRALPILKRSEFFIEQWKKYHVIYAGYKPDGTPQNKDKFVGTPALLVSAIDVFDKKTASEIYKNEIIPYFRGKGYWDSRKDYYGQNLLWLGWYLYKLD